MRIFFFSGALILTVITCGYCGGAAGAFEQLKSELKNQGLSDQFIKTTENSVKRMLVSDAKISDVRTVLLDLWNQGVKARALKNAVAAVAELVASGDDTLEASRIASGAAHKAEAEGLSGFGVGRRVKKAVQDRKAYLKSLKK
ncbi:MAG: hypothetical protein PHV92_04480 [Candidatus Omnitrophica bacterium]|jgi:hypothetical protein|nr:hypothetical protein [Candidatus Omnitrophota bacterium]MDD5518349.1 hypothetical protein [Candidatus Omnitrophota bacterium]